VIDLHAHLLPAIDDGPETLEGSVALARAAAECGTKVMTATPHLRADHPGVRVHELAERCHALGDAVGSAGIPIKVVPAAEVDLLWAYAASCEQLRLATYGQRGTDLLLETPYGPLPPNFGSLVMRLTERGVRVLLAHPERNLTVQRNPRLVVDLVARGVLVQLTAMSLTRASKGSPAQRAAIWLLEQGAGHVIASDAHSAGPWRGPDLRAAAGRVDSVAPAQAEWMTHEVPHAVLAGEPLPPSPVASAAGGTLRRLGSKRSVGRMLSATLGSRAAS